MYIGQNIKIKSVSVGNNFVMIITHLEKLYAWGSNKY
jgi:alpha-tubulin suppressor-like RCC1 family protein